MAAMPSPASRRLLRRGLIAGGVVALVVAGLVLYVLLHKPGNVSNPKVQFTQPSSATTTSSTTTAQRRRAANTFSWPWYGYDGGRTRAFSASSHLRPPFHHGWSFNDGALLEFPPVIWHGMMFMLGDDGIAKAIHTSNGRMVWHRRVGTLAAASPAVDGRHGVVVMPVLSVAGHVPGGGRFVALSLKTGRILWSHPDPPGTESSPIVSGNTAYYGDQAGALTAIRTTDGHVFWTYHASGAIKGGPALVGGVLYFGDYAGRAYAVRAVNGRQVWAVGTSGARFGFGSGNFYATPSVAFGRVYMGNTDGRVYSFGIRHGALAWATGTGAYVYAAAAAADPPGIGPTVYVGSYDGSFYALSAYSGQVRWVYHAGGRISGSPTIIGDIVYFADLARRQTIGLNVRGGWRAWSEHTGSFDPVVTDGRRLYLTGYYGLYGLDPTRQPVTVAAPARPAAVAATAPAAIPYKFRWPPPLPNLLATNYARSQQRDAQAPR